jgi:hypothetical protein
MWFVDNFHTGRGVYAETQTILLRIMENVETNRRVIDVEDNHVTFSCLRDKHGNNQLSEGKEKMSVRGQ